MLKATSSAPQKKGEPPPPEPACVIDGLAVYNVGEGPPLLLMPYPHGYHVAPTAHGPLANLLAGMGRRVITFDPPGAYRSERLPQLTMEEMLEATEETLAALNVTGPLDVVGHSLGGLCALALALARPERIQRLALVASMAGYPAILRAGGFPQNLKVTSRDFWTVMIWGLRLAAGRANMAEHKRIVQLLWRISYVDPSLAPPVVVLDKDRHRPAPIRDRWTLAIRKIDYHDQLPHVQAPTLVMAGRHDPQAPVRCSQELADGIVGARLVVFEKSGHYPFVEERARFRSDIFRFLGA